MQKKTRNKLIGFLVALTFLIGMVGAQMGAVIHPQGSGNDLANMEPKAATYTEYADVEDIASGADAEYGTDNWTSATQTESSNDVYTTLTTETSAITEVWDNSSDDFLFSGVTTPPPAEIGSNGWTELTYGGGTFSMNAHSDATGSPGTVGGNGYQYAVAAQLQNAFANSTHLLEQTYNDDYNLEFDLCVIENAMVGNPTQVWEVVMYSGSTAVLGVHLVNSVFRYIQLWADTGSGYAIQAASLVGALPMDEWLHYSLTVVDDTSVNLVVTDCDNASTIWSPSTVTGLATTAADRVLYKSEATGIVFLAHTGIFDSWLDNVDFSALMSYDYEHDYNGTIDFTMPSEIVDEDKITGMDVLFEHSDGGDDFTGTGPAENQTIEIYNYTGASWEMLDDEIDENSDTNDTYSLGGTFGDYINDTDDALQLRIILETAVQNNDPAQKDMDIDWLQIKFEFEQIAVGNANATIDVDIDVSDCIPNVTTSTISFNITDNNSLYDLNKIDVILWANAEGYTELSGDNVLGHYTLTLTEDGIENSTGAVWNETDTLGAFTVQSTPDDDTVATGEFNITFTPAKIALATAAASGGWHAVLVVYEDFNNNQTVAEAYGDATKSASDDTFDMAGYVEITTGDSAPFNASRRGETDVGLQGDGDVDFNVIANTQWKVQVQANTSNLQNPSLDNLPITTIEYDDDDSVAGAVGLTTLWADTDIITQSSTGASGSDKLFGLWIDLPGDQADGTYTGAEFEIRAVLTGDGYSTTDTPVTQPELSITLSIATVIQNQQVDAADVGLAELDPTVGSTFTFQVVDPGTMDLVKTVDIYIYHTSAAWNNSDHRNNHYTITWTEDADTWTGSLITYFSTFTDPGANSGSTTGSFAFEFTPSTIALEGVVNVTDSWIWRVVVTDDHDATTTWDSAVDDSDYMNMSAYINIVYDDPLFSFSGSPGDNNVRASAGGDDYVNFTVIANFDFDVKIGATDLVHTDTVHSIDVQAQLTVDDGDSESGSIAMPEVGSKLVFSANNTASSAEAGNALFYSMWLDIPVPTYDGAYSMTTSLEVTVAA